MEGGTMSGALEFLGDIAAQTVYLFLLAGAAFIRSTAERNKSVSVRSGRTVSAPAC